MHRDVKPENILLDAGSGRAMELGLARADGRRGAGRSAELVTSAPTRRAVLTPLFAAPFRLQQEVDIEGEISPDDYDVIVEQQLTLLREELEVEVRASIAAQQPR